MTAFTFWNLSTVLADLLDDPGDGFCQLALFGGYSIYLPELFPTRLRSTGTSFCYNVGRFVAASAAGARPAHQPRVRLAGRAHALRGRDDVRRLPRRPRGGSVRARDAWTCIARMSEHRRHSHMLQSLTLTGRVAVVGGRRASAAIALGLAEAAPMSCRPGDAEPWLSQRAWRSGGIGRRRCGSDRRAETLRDRAPSRSGAR